MAEQTNQETILKVDTDKGLTSEEIAEITGIKGIAKAVVQKKDNQKKKQRYDTKSFMIDRYIYENYHGGGSFATSLMSQYFREMKGWSSSDVSGQLYAKKNAGLLESRKPTADEASIVGKGVSIWNTTPKVDEMMKSELEEFEKSSESKLVSEEGQELNIQ